ncbi:MAG: glycosyltransferase family 2 protein [Lachnospiraceae bacterium]|nr:glycosyltransferase family 2 protein [Lachnospiraceae bacterium]
MKKKLSIVIVSYNEAEYLRKAIDSCLNIKFNMEYEIIIGDDGSNDESIHIIKEYVCKYSDRIKAFVMKRDASQDVIASLRVSNVIKTAFSMAEGDYFIIMSADDYYCDECFFERAIRYLDKNKTFVAYISNFKLVWDTKEEFYPVYKFSPTTFFGTHSYTHISTIIFRRTVYDDNKLLDRFCDDVGLTYSIACSGEWHFENNTTFCYRQRKGSIMDRIKKDKLQNNIVELLLLQDMLNAKKMKLQVLAYSCDPLWYVFSMRKELVKKQEKYKKYIRNARKYDSNVLSMIIEFDERGLCVNNIKLFAIMIVSKLMQSTYNALKYLLKKRKVNI